MIRHGLLSEREDEVMRLASEGYSESEIAALLGISSATVHKQRDAARQKLRAPSLPAATARYREWCVRVEIAAYPARRRRRSEPQSESLELVP